MADVPEPLTPLDESWERALCVVAHPDDLEFGAAAAVARWTGQGKSVVYCMVTSGEAGIDGMDPDECRRVREEEQRRSAEVVGVDTVEFLGQPDGVLEYGVALREVITASVRRHRPEIVVTGNFRDTWGGANLNQADHIATGRAVVDAVRDAGNRWIFRDQVEAGGSSRGAASARSGRSARRAPATASTPPTPSTRGSPRWRRIARTSTASAGSTSTGASSSRVTRARPVSGWGSAFAASFEVFPMGWGD